MNRIYRLVWNRTLGVLQVASEFTRARTRGGRTAGPGRVRRLAWLAGVPLGLPLAALATPMAAVSLAPVSTETATIAAVSPGTLPTGGTVTAGRGQITQGGNTLTVTQQSQNLSLNWQTFNVGPDGTVNFLQPNAQAIAVNRISDANGSVILGHLNANGQVFLINPNGVLFGQGAQVNVGGLVASTLDVGDSELGSGTLHFSGTGDGRVVNRGTINAAGGYVALLSAQVSNAGTISANGGTVALAGGTAVTLSFNNNRMLSLQVDKSTLNALAENRQLIVADGGQVLMSAGAKDSLLASVVNNSGTIQARTVENRGGRIVLLGGMAAGTTDVAGTLDASAPNGGDGGFIETSAAHVHVADSATVTAKSADGKTGTWLIDPADFTIAASGGDITGTLLSTQLGSANVTIQSSSGASGTAGDVNVNDSVSWGAHILTLNAQHNININVALNATGTAGLALEYGQGAVAAGNTSSVQVNAPVNLARTGSFSTKLGSDGATTSYTIIDSLGAAGSVTGTDLQGMSVNLAGKYVLGANIDATATSGWNAGAGFAPVGDSTNNFTGIFDGLGHTVSGLTINRPSTSYVGLFGQTATGAAIRNVGLVGGSVLGGYSVGGLVGYNGSPISNSYAAGSVTGSGDNIGGLVGFNGSTISNSHATGSVSSSGSSMYVGGLAGRNNNGSSISNSYATGSVSGGSYGGGLVGYNFGPISNSYATGSVSGGSDVGGLVGVNGDSITNAYATGSVSGGGAVGGLVGVNDSVITNAYASGRVTGSTAVGGLVGLDLIGTSWSTVNCYWDSYSTGQSSAGVLQATAVTSNPAQSGAANDAFQQSAYGGFDFANTWYMVDGSTRPFLRSEYSTTVSNAHQLQLMGMNLGANYTLAQNIDATETGTAGTRPAGMWAGAGFAPVGDGTNQFTGSLDGLGHTISGLTINRPSASDVGLFGYTNTGSTIRNLGLLGGSVTGSSNVGSLVGNNSNGTISQVYATGPVSGTSNVGGLLGYSFNGTISQAYATGAVNGSSNVGGLAGANYNGTISQVHATGVVSGTSGVGGLVGYNFNAGTISQAYATGAVSGTNNVGGLVGYNFSDTISQAYATGAVSGTSGVGGLVGSTSSGTISQAYATGAVSGSSSFGGLVGYNTNAAITTSYWDTATTGQATSAGGGTGLTTSALIAALPGGFSTSAWGNGDNQTTPYLLGMAGNQVFNVNDLPSGAISSTNRPKLYTAILDVDQLQGVNAGLAGRYVLGNNIDASGTANWNTHAGFAPIGDSTTPFTGIFDGLGHTISGLTINRPGTSYVGLIGYMGNNSAIRNLGLLGGSVRGNNSVGGLVGRNNFGTISWVYATGAVSGGAGVGGLVGVNNGTISQAHATGKVSGGSGSGGLVGSSSGTITRAYATGAVSGDVSVGGLVGSAQNGTISQVFATGAVDGIVHIGGLVGSNSSNSISQAYATGAVSGASSSVGGLVGSDSRGTISQTYATGAVSGVSSVGGLVGDTYFSAITTSYWATETTGRATSAGGGTGLTTSALIAALPGGFATSTWGNGDNQTTPYLLGMAGNQVFNANDLPTGTISSTNRPNLYTAILDVNQLQGVNAGLTGRYVLSNNIDASATASWNSGAGFAPIGDNTTPFTGIFDGLGHRISGLAINRPTTNDVGLFGHASTNSVIRNVDLVGGSVVGGSYVGGLVGDNDSGTISQASATGAVSGSYYVGALVGLNSLNGTISQVYATGAVSGTYGVGGLVGSNSNGTISQAHATGAVSGTYYVGGLVGVSVNGAISQAYATGVVSGASAAGGLVGVSVNGAISQAYATGAVSGTVGVGGLAGASSGTISQAYATGAVSGNSNVGGLVGNNNIGTISQAYATGAVSGSGHVGGLVGHDLGGTITTSYWDAATTGQAASSGSTNNNGLTTTALIATLPTGFDLAYWGNGDNQATPYLLGMAGNQVFNVNDLPSGTISSTNRPNLYTAILDVDQLQAVNADLTGRYVLGNDIDASATVGWNSGAGFAPLGDGTTTFTGIFDGLGHSISGLAIDRPSTGYVGLFGYVSANSVIRNVGLVGGSVAGGSSVGGLVGYNDSGTISQAYATVSVSGIVGVGGLVGNNSNGTISQAHAAGSVSGSSNVGGLVGGNSHGAISQAYATGAVSGDYYVGGLIGNNDYSTIGQVYAAGAVSGTGSKVGGLVGVNSNSTISQAYATGVVSGTGSNKVGGLVGSNYGGTISQAYATGAVSGTGSKVGGLIGTNYSGTINQTYATGAVSGSSVVGGLVGSSNLGAITASYWDTATSGQATSAGGGTGLTTPQMKDPASFLAAWGSAISASGGGSAAWRIYAGDTAPLLRAFMTGLAVTSTNVITTYNASAYAGSGAFTYGTPTPSYWLPSGSVDGALILGTANTGTSAINAGSYTLGHSPYSSQLGYDISYTAGALTIDKAALTISTGAVGKTYDGGLSAAGTALLTGGTLFGSDSLSGGSFAFTDKNVGTGKTVTVAGVTVNDGNSGNNYLVTYANNTTSSISALGITVDAAGSNRVYDGSTADAVALASTGILAGDTVSFSGTGRFADKNVGTGKTVNVSGISASGADAGNYRFNTTASTTADITALGITVGATGSNRVYDGTTADAVSLASSGILAGDTVSFSGTGRFADKNVGTGKTVSVSGISASGADAGNYGFNTTASTTADITQAALTIGTSDVGKTYDGGLSAAGTALVTGGTLSGGDSLSGGSFAFTDKNVGTGKTVTVAGVTVNDGNSGNNYRVTYANNTASSISALGVRVDAAGNNRVYDGSTADAVSLASSGILAGDTVSFSGTGRFADKNVGTGKTVSVSGISASGADAGNYGFNTTASTTADITPATLTFHATPASIFVGQTPTGLSGEVQGLVGGDTLADATTGMLAWTTPATSASLAGQYAIEGSGLRAGNYLLMQAPDNATALQVSIYGVPAIVTAAVADLQRGNTSAGNELAGLQQRTTSDRRDIAELPQRKARERHDLMTPDIRVVGGGVRLP